MVMNCHTRNSFGISRCPFMPGNGPYIPTSHSRGLLLYQEPQAQTWNTFSQNWQGFLYAYPPLPVLGMVLQKIVVDQVTVILIAPFLPQRSWFSDLLHQLIHLVVLLQIWQDLLHNCDCFIWMHSFSSWQFGKCLAMLQRHRLF